MTKSVAIAPSLLSADFSQLGQEIRALEAAGADYIHLDVMDGHFVPNLTFGPPVVKALRSYTSKPFDVHLMVKNPDPLIPVFAEAGADIMTVHPESGLHLHRTLQTIKSLGKKAGVALNPATSEHMLDHVIDMLDLVLVMTVNPGFGGQAFLPSQRAKIRAVRQKLDAVSKATGQRILLEVDGGVNVDNAPELRADGVDIFVAGTAVFKGGMGAYASNIKALRGVLL